MNNSSSTSPPPKRHSACDECRARKLKCSGTPSGCARCLRDSIACHYSLQKPMGRPRKRRRAAEDEGDETFDDALEINDIEIPSVSAMSPPLTTGVGGGLLLDGLGEELGWLDSGELGLMGVDLFGTPPPAPSTELVPHLQQQHHHHHPTALGAAAYTPSIPPHLSSPSIPTPPPSSSSSSSSSSFINFFNHAYILSTISPMETSDSCSSCLPSFLSCISTLHSTPLSAITLPTTLSVSRRVLSVVRDALVCTVCLNSHMSAFTTNMLVGVALPQLVLFYRKALHNIELVQGGQMVDVGGGAQVMMEEGPWKEMARGAVRKELETLLEVCMVMERRSRARHPELRDPQRKEGANEPMCMAVLTTVRQVAGTLPFKMLEGTACGS